MINGVTIDTEILDKMREEAKANAGAIVEKYGWLIANDSAKNAPVDTSALRNSILSESGMTTETKFRVQDGVEYGVFQELGTSRIPAQPFMIPAVEKYVDGFLNAFAALFGFEDLF